jgi:hypothetical protein
MLPLLSPESVIPICLLTSSDADGHVDHMVGLARSAKLLLE